MKMSKVAKMIGVDRRTIYNWVTNPSLSHLFSPGAQNEGDRDLNEEDIFVVNTINHLRQNITTNWDEIAQRMDEGYRVTDLSINATDVDTGKTPLQQFTRTLAIAQERDMALKQLDEVRQELDQMKTSYKAEIEDLRQQYEEKLNDEQQSRREEIERLTRETSERVDSVRDEERQRADKREQELTEQLIKLNRQIARLEVRIEIMQEGDDEDDD